MTIQRYTTSTPSTPTNDSTQTKYIFHESDDGLYYHEVKSTQQIYITTVTENKQKYSQNDVKRVDGVLSLAKSNRTSHRQTALISARPSPHSKLPIYVT